MAPTVTVGINERSVMLGCALITGQHIVSERSMGLVWMLLGAAAVTLLINERLVVLQAVPTNGSYSDCRDQ
jgi:hypothetical protein